MIRLESDFSDYYDYTCSDTGSILYRRYRNTGMSRGEELNQLKKLGIRTIGFGPISNFSPLINNKLVVYTNPTLHNFDGKMVVDYRDAASQYTNYLMAEFLEKSGGYTVKYLQVGERRFQIMFHNPNYKDRLVEGSPVKVEELPKQYNRAIGLPIFSIDYISDGAEMIAVDFNTVQSLQSIGFDKVIPAAEVAREVECALVAYNMV